MCVANRFAVHTHISSPTHKNQHAPVTLLSQKHLRSLPNRDDPRLSNTSIKSDNTRLGHSPHCLTNNTAVGISQEKSNKQNRKNQKNIYGS